jgi:hypothetical protein
VFEILQPDGTAIGTIVSMSLVEALFHLVPLLVQLAGIGLAGGTGAFLAARGQIEGWGGPHLQSSVGVYD